MENKKLNSESVSMSYKETTPLLFAQETQRLVLRQKLAYGVGHVYNDICAAIWFSYGLIYLQLVANTGPVLAGILLFIGQAVDAFATPLAGFLVGRFGSKKGWHLIGSVLVGVTFPLVFTVFKVFQGSVWTQAVYYASAITIFQIGWAMVQIAHLSLLPEMSPLTTERAALTAHRYTASMGSHILVYLIAWAFLSSTKGMNMKLISPKDAPKFQYITLLSSGIGIICSLIFYTLLKRTWTNVTPTENGIVKDEKPKKNSEFYRSSQLYKVAVIYTSSRLFLTLSLEYMPMFINEVVLSESTTLATVPLVSFLASCIASMAVKALTTYCGGNRVTYIVGCIFCALGCVFIQLHRFKSDDTVKIFIAAVLFGAGSSVTMVVSLCVTANLIGADTESGAFVYSAVTFADKLLNGLAVITIENLRCDDPNQCPFYYRDVLAYVNGTVAALGLIALMLLPSKLFARTDNTL